MYGTKCVPEFRGDYFDKPWYERDLIGYFDYLDYRNMLKNPMEYFQKKKVINFDIIHHEWRGDPLQGSYKVYQTVKSNDLEQYPQLKKNETVDGLIRNIKRNDLFIDKCIVKEHFKR